MSQPSQFIVDLKSKMTDHDWELLQSITTHLKKALSTDLRSAGEDTAVLIGTILMAAKVMLPQGNYSKWLHFEIDLPASKATRYQWAARNAGKSFMALHEMLPQAP